MILDEAMGEDCIMAKITNTIKNTITKRLTKKVPEFQKILRSAQQNDVNESDTVTIVKDILEAVFGWDKYEEITSEYKIGNTTRCDLAIKLNAKIRYLVEVKAIGSNLKDNHLRQVVGYAANKGITWVVLTNGILWQIHKVTIKGKVTHERVIEFSFLEINLRKPDDQNSLFVLCRRGTDKGMIDDYYERKQAVNPFTLSAILQSDPVIKIVARQMKKMKSGLKIDNKEIVQLLKEDVIKRNLVEADETKKALKHKQLKKNLSNTKPKQRIKSKETASQLTSNSSPNHPKPQK